MLTIEKGFQRKYQYGGSGLSDTIMSAVTSNAAKEIATNVGKKAVTEVGNRTTKKVIDKVIPKNRHILDKHLNDNEIHIENFIRK